MSHTKTKGMLFNNSEGLPFYYSPLTGRIIKLPKKISEEMLIPENFNFKFGYDTDEIKKKLSSNLEILVLEGSQDCNLRCGYCIFGGNYLGERNHKPFNMNLNTARKSIEYFLEHSLETRPLRAISFYGGEPLMNFELIRKIIDEYGKEKRTFFTISTNGIFLEKYADYLRENEVTISLSLDGPREIHDKNRVTINGKPTYDIIMKGLKKLGEDFVKRKLSFSSTITKSEDFIESYKYFRDNYPNNGVRLEFIKNYDCLDKPQKNLKVPKEDFNLMIRDYKEGIEKGNVPRVLKFLFDDVFQRINSRQREYSGSLLRHKKTCIPGTKRLFVQANGNFYICEKLGYEQFKIGNADKGIEEQKVFQLMDDINRTMNTYCSKCQIAPLCNVCIPVNELSCGEVSNERLQKNCNNRRETIRTHLGVYVELNEILGKKLTRYLSN